MIRALSLRQRVVLSAVAVVAVTLFVADLFVFVVLGPDLGRDSDNLLAFQALATVGGLCLAALLMIRMARKALEPVDVVVATARQIASGDITQRLRPEPENTELGRMCAAFDEMLDSLESALDEARQASALNQDFLADAAHQLRSPLAGIKASAELLHTHAVSADDEKRLLENLVRSSDRITMLVNALLRMAAIDHGGVAAGVPADLSGLCLESVERARDLAPALVIDLSNDRMPDGVEVDPASMREAVDNLLDNARRHAIDRIDVSLRRVNGSVEIAVADDGPGLRPELAGRVFNRFATFDACGGAGLGLPIARGIARAHGGDLVYTGDAFRLTVPATSAPSGA